MGVYYICNMEKKYENVIWARDKNKYKAVFKFNGKRIHVGYSKNDPKGLSEKAAALKRKMEEDRLNEVESIRDQGEEFKWVKGFENYVSISNHGRVKAYGPVRYGIIAEDSEEFVYNNKNRVNQKKFYKRKLVAEYFMGVDNPNNYEYSFKDGDSLNCHTDNIELRSLDEIQEEESERRKSIASGYEGVYYDKRKKSYITETNIEGKTKRFYSTDHTKSALEKRDSYKEEHYKCCSKEIEEQLLLNETFKRSTTLPSILVSNKGRVIRDKYPVKRLLYPKPDKAGYCRVSETVEGKNIIKGVHQLVAEVFLGHTLCGHEKVVDHINHDKLDNRVENLQIVSNRINSGRKKKRAICTLPGVRLNEWGRYYSEAVVKGENNYLGTYETEKEAHKAYVDFLREVGEEL